MAGSSFRPDRESSMQPCPRISLCIPTWDGADCLREALESGLREALSLPSGTVEMLVYDNASPDWGATEAIIAEIRGKHPELRTLRNDENNIGFDLNYLRLVEEARGEFVWVLGGDDVWLPGSVARVLQELDLGADACLCLAHTGDMKMHPKGVLSWYLDPDPPRVWHLETREDLIRYFKDCAHNAGAFALSSVGIFRRDRFLEHREAMLESVCHGLTFIQVWGMMLFFRQPLILRYIPEPLILKRMDAAPVDPYKRWMFDLKGWAAIADGVFADDPEIREAFSTIVGRNHHDTILHGLSLLDGKEDRWLEAKPYLVRAGFSPIWIAAADYSFQTFSQSRVPSPHLNATSLCFADLGLVTRAAKRIAILALGSLEDLFKGAPLLTSLREAGRAVRVLVTAEGAPYLDGFDIRRVDPARYVRDVSYRESEAQALVDFAPELIVNLDRNRELWGDDLVSAVQSPGALAFELPNRGQDAQLVRMVNGNYHCMLPKDAAPEALLNTLGLATAGTALWPPQAAIREANILMARLNWNPTRTVAVIVDHPSILENPAFKDALSEVGRGGWILLVLEGKGTHARLSVLLAPWKDQSLHLAGLSPLTTAAILGQCARFIGGTPILRAMAQACGCAQLESGSVPQVGTC